MFEFFYKYTSDVYARGELVYAGLWPAWLLVLLAATGALAIVRLLWRRRGDTSALALSAVAGVQFAMLALVLWVLQEPTLRTEKLRDGANSLALVLDTSASMAYGPGTSRLEQARRSLDNTTTIAGAPQLAIQRYEFAGGIAAVESFEAASARGSSTSLADALNAVLREARFGPLAAVVLATDGADTGGGISAAELADIAGFGVPVHTVGVGRERIPEDLELTEALLPAHAPPGSTISARVSVRHDVVGSTRVKVYDGDSLLASQEMQLQQETGISTAWIEIELPLAGHRSLTFAVDPLDGEQELRNNRVTRLIDVREREYTVLYYEGEPRWEFKFLRRAVSQDPDLRIVSLLRVSQNKYYRQGLDTPEQLAEGFPQTREELFAYDALIVGSVEAASLSLAQQQLIHDFVNERGGSLLMLGGPNGLGNGGWGQSSLAPALPVVLSASKRSTFYRKQVPVSLTPYGNDSRLLRLAPGSDANRRAWNELPNLANFQRTGTLKPAAVSLLNVRTEFGEQPLLIRQAYGRGSSYVLASGGTWRWQMSLPVEDQRHETFWRQLLREMAGSSPAKFSLTADGSPGQQEIMLRAEFRDEAFRPVQGIDVTAVLSRQDGTTETLQLAASADEAGTYRAEFAPTTSGIVYVEALATQNGEPWQTVRAAVHHTAGQAEHINFRKNRTLLRRLSDATGGQYLETSGLAALPDLLRYSAAGVTEQELRPIWDAPAVFLLLILLKSGEWLLRRRWRSI